MMILPSLLGAGLLYAVVSDDDDDQEAQDDPQTPRITPDTQDMLTIADSAEETEEVAAGDARTPNPLPEPETREMDGSGNDGLDGGRDGNTLEGGAGEDSLSGTSGSDRLIGNEGADTLLGDGGDDVLIGGDGLDDIFGGSGDDILRGGKGSDVLFGNEGRDELIGAAGNDILVGGAGDDVMDGGRGDDVFYANGGTDFIFTGSGSDVIEVSSSATIDDFDPALDRIDLARLYPPSGSSDDVPAQAGREIEVVLTEGTDGDTPYTEITLTPASAEGASNGDLVLRLSNVTPDQLSGGNFTTFTAIDSPT